MIKCVTHKKVYLTETLAEEALIGARTAYNYTRDNGPVAVYRCDDCGYYHLTSRGPMNLKLEQLIKGGTIDRQKEADAWLNKLKHKR